VPRASRCLSLRFAWIVGRVCVLDVEWPLRVNLDYDLAVGSKGVMVHVRGQIDETARAEFLSVGFIKLASHAEAKRSCDAAAIEQARQYLEEC